MLLHITLSLNLKFLCVSCSRDDNNEDTVMNDTIATNSSNIFCRFEVEKIAIANQYFGLCLLFTYWNCYTVLSISN